jgi:hypothetical protein
MTDYMRQYREEREALAARHDEGAADAMHAAIHDNADVSCLAYCYGGSASVDATEVLADLAEAGWKVVRDA